MEEEEYCRVLMQRMAVSDIRSMAEVARGISGDVQKQENQAHVLDGLVYHNGVRQTTYLQVVKGGQTTASCGQIL